MYSRGLPLALIWILLEYVNALQVDVKVDDKDSRIQYIGRSWTTVEACEQCAAGLDISQAEGGTFHMVNQADNKAVFEFTGTAISIFGVVPSRVWGDSPSNVSFTIDGSEQSRGIANADEREYNKTLFHADNLPNSAHTLSIQTHGDALFIFDYLTYKTNTTAVSAAANDTSATQSTPLATSTPEQNTTATSGAQPAVVGGVIGGIFGTFLIIGVFGLWYIKRANRRRHTRKSSSDRTPRRAPMDRNDFISPIAKRGKGESGSSSGGPSDSKDGKRKEGRPVEYAFTTSPKPAHTSTPLTTTRRMEALSAAATGGGGGGYRSATSTYTSSHSGIDDKPQVIHAITTDTPQEAHPLPLYGPSKWPNTKRPSTADAVRAKRPFSSGSTLEVDGVLERVMFNHSSSPGFASTQKEERPAVFFSEHPFRTMGSG